ncbi:MAG: acetoacetate decarboxylase family protein [Candidatus Binatia bacterium]|nr:acetoacetate decarboxylase family protein [Candidatus Binatia bacterium]
MMEVFSPTQGSEPTAQRYEVLGQTVVMPCRVRAAKAANVVYSVPAEAARSFIGPALEPLEHERGQSQLVLGFVDYTDNDLGPYREVMVVFFVRPRVHSAVQPGTFIYRLPVDGEFTCAAGRQIWGFPKTVERIDLDYTADQVCCRLFLDGEFAVGLTLPRTGGMEMPEDESVMNTFTYHPDLCVVEFSSGMRGARMFPAGAGVELELGSHQLATELRTLGLPSTPLFATWAEHFFGAFGPPKRLPQL